MIKTILEITKKLEENNINYFLTGSSSLFLRKIEKTFRDIDLCVKKEDLKKTKEVFKEERLLTSNKKAITFYKDSLEVEILLISPETDPLSNKILEENGYEIKTFQKQDVKIISLKDLLSTYRFVYLRDGKEKYLERIKLIEKLVK